jgi:hypothetical protein
VEKEALYISAELGVSGSTEIIYKCFLFYSFMKRGEKMTIKDYNRIRHAAYLEATQIPDIKKVLDSSKVAYVYDIWSTLPQPHGGGRKHAVVCLSAPTQMNDELLRNHGFNPENAEVRLKLTVNKTAQTVGFY